VRAFEGLTPDAPGIVVRKVFGQPAALVNGHMFLGVFGSHLVVRLSDQDAANAVPRLAPFEPMPGRPMRGFYLLPDSLPVDLAGSRPWVARALAHARGLPAKARRPRRR
jgi:hypothetical protein